VEVGIGHHCYFFAYGWKSEKEAEAALAPIVGEDFIGRGRTIPQDPDWRFLFTGSVKGPYPKANFGVI